MIAILKVRNFYGVKTVLESFGVEPAAVLRELGLPADLFADREAFMRYADFGRLMAASGRACGCDDFSFRVGKLQDATAIGLVGLASLHALKVGEALATIAAHLHQCDTGGVFSVEIRGSMAVSSYVVAAPDVEAADELVDGALAMVHNLMRQLCGPEFSAEQVALPRRAPRDPKSYRAFFEAPVEFGASAGRLSCDAQWLERAVVNRNPDYIDILAPLLRKSNPAAGDFIATVKAVLKAQTSSGRLTRARAAQALGLSEHGLVARLAEKGANFSELADRIRYDLARELLAAGGDQRAVAAELGFADASAFNRAFVKWSGVSPGRWRARGAETVS